MQKSKRRTARERFCFGKNRFSLNIVANPEANGIAEITRVASPEKGKWPKSTEWEIKTCKYSRLGEMTLINLVVTEYNDGSGRCLCEVKSDGIPNILCARSIMHVGEVGKVMEEVIACLLAFVNPIAPITISDGM